MNPKLAAVIMTYIFAAIVGMGFIILFNYNSIEALVITVLFCIALIQVINFLGILDKSK